MPPPHTASSQEQGQVRTGPHRCCVSRCQSEAGKLVWKMAKAIVNPGRKGSVNLGSCMNGGGSGRDGAVLQASVGGGIRLREQCPGEVRLLPMGPLMSQTLSLSAVYLSTGWCSQQACFQVEFCCYFLPKYLISSGPFGLLFCLVTPMLTGPALNRVR